jgi:UDP-N-acetylmuramoyl-L-alanyl-D-glutamate--2,6-diaminopimelate ligase
MKIGPWSEARSLRSSGSMETEIHELTCDSRDVAPGWGFVALRGEKTDGAEFIPAALAKGASAIFADRWLDLPSTVPFVHLAEPRAQMAELAREVHGRPDEKLVLIGVTGTNGKTTTTMLIRQLLSNIGLGCGLIGTVYLAAGTEEREADRTSPESPVFYRWLRRSVEAGDVAVATEVSSHALCLDRVRGARFRVGLFTNLTQDHLDYHGTLEAYFEAKCRLFAQCEKGLVNADDPFGQRLLESMPGLRSFGIDRDADYRLQDLVLEPTGTRFRLETPMGAWNVKSPLLARFNAYNLLSALAILSEAGFDLNTLLGAVPRLNGAPGRLERVDLGQPFGVMVDYAHTPDALEKLLTAGRDMLPAGARLHVLFGCGGDRDRTKRPIMAAAVAAGADVLWHTSDNTRTENPESILDDATSGIPKNILQDPKRYHRIADRALAVGAALADCRPGDLLLLAGKGHEPYQDVMGVKHPYSDRAAIEATLRGQKVPRPWAE